MNKLIALLTAAVLAFSLAAVAPLASAGSSSEAVADASGNKKKKKKQKKKVMKQLSDGQYIGDRGTFQTVDWTFCKNKRYQLRTSSSSGTGVTNEKGWKVSKVQGYKSAKKWKAIIIDKSNGLSIAMARKGKKWFSGFENFDKAEDFGEVERTNAKARCAELKNEPLDG